MAESMNQNQQQDLVSELELWKFLPSDIFPPDQQLEVYPRRNRPNNSSFDYHLYRGYSDSSAFCMAAQRENQGLTSFSFNGGGPPQQPPQRFNLSSPSPSLELFRMADRRTFPGPFPEWVCCLSGEFSRVGYNPVHQHGAGTVWPGFGPGNPYQNRNPVQIQAECFMEERARALQAMQYRSWMNRVTKTRVFPLRGGGGVGETGGAGFLGGTGVYLPRIPANISSTTAANRGRKQGARVRQGNEDAQKKKKEDCCSQKASAEHEAGLPEEWTY